MHGVLLRTAFDESRPFSMNRNSSRSAWVISKDSVFLPCLVKTWTTVIDAAKPPDRMLVLSVVGSDVNSLDKALLTMTDFDARVWWIAETEYAMLELHQIDLLYGGLIDDRELVWKPMTVEGLEA